MVTDNNNATEIKKDAENGSAKTALQETLTGSKQSALQKYQAIVIGRPGLFRLLLFELLTTLLGPLPGALGLLLRKKLYPLLLGKVGRNVVFGRSLTIRHPHKIVIGDNCIIDDYAVLDAKGDSNTGITMGSNVMLGRNSVLSCKNGDLIIGDNVNIAMNCFLQSAATVRIGRDTLLSAYCYLIGGGDHKIIRKDIPIMAQGQVVRGIEIGQDCLLGAGVYVQDGVNIGKGSVMGTGATVTENMPEYVVAVGVPAKVIKNR
ncbi:MAG: acyltransferase [Desulfobulbaceae bacterium]|nr:acyltransferase [Desulfobulbaceae bacterium]